MNKTLVSGGRRSPPGRRRPLSLLSTILIVVGICGHRFIIQEERSVQCSRDRLKRTRCLGQVEKAGEIVASSFIRKGERALLNTKVVFHKPQDTAKIMSVVVYAYTPKVNINNNRRDFNTVLLAILRKLQNQASALAFPASPARPEMTDFSLV